MLFCLLAYMLIKSKCMKILRTISCLLLFNTFTLNTNKFNTNNLNYNVYLNRCLFQLLFLFIHGQDITKIDFYYRCPQTKWCMG